MPQIIPAILTNNQQDFIKKYTLLSSFANRIQVDIADGKFVNNITLSLDQLPKEILTKDTELHLMTINPEKIISSHIPATTKTIIFHYEALNDIEDVLEVFPPNIEKGLAINPTTQISQIKPFLNNISVVLIMGIVPGFQGREFIPSTIQRIAELRAMDKNITIEVDGGINNNNALHIALAGADRLVVGSSILKADNPEAVYKSLNEIINKEVK